jgi:hypothetical protein
MMNHLPISSPLDRQLPSSHELRKMILLKDSFKYEPFRSLISLSTTKPSESLPFDGIYPEFILSFVESTMNDFVHKEFTVDFQRHNTIHPIRVYPVELQIDSANFDSTKKMELRLKMPPSISRLNQSQCDSTTHSFG